jgi:SPP1 gp7 family putative phage head morphogenesis protein
MMKMGLFSLFRRDEPAESAMRADGAPEFSLPSSRDFGPALGNQPTPAALLSANVGVPDMATRAIANRMAALNPLVQVSRRGADGTMIDETLDDNALKLLLDRPHPNFTRAQLFRLSTQWIVTVGEANWLKVRSGLRTPVELHPIPPSQIVPLVRSNVVDSYRITTGDGRQQIWPASEVVRIFLPDPESPFAAEGYLAPNATTVDSHKYAGEHLKTHYQYDATPKTALEAGPDAEKFSDREERRFNFKWRKKYTRRTGTQVGVPALVPTGYKLIQLLMQSGADIRPLLEFWTDEQLMNFGVPKSILGKVVSGDRSSAETNQFVFDLHTIEPLAMLISDAITLQLAPDFDASLHVEFEEFVSKDKEHVLKQEDQDLRTMVRSPDMVRQDRGWDKVPWGERPVATLGQVAYDPDGVIDLDEDDEGAIEDNDDSDDERSRAGRAPLTPACARGKDPFPARAAFFEPERIWRRQIRREKKFVPAMLRANRSIFRKQRDDVLKNLEEKYGERGLTRVDVDVSDLFDYTDWYKVYRKTTEPIRKAAFVEATAETLDGLGVGSDFTFTDEMAKTLKKQGAQYMKEVGKTTKRRIARQLAEGAAEGESIDKIAKRIEGVFKVRRKDARTIARNEVLKANSQAQLTAFDTSGVVEKKEWNDSMDDAVRDNHAYMQERVVEINDPFVLGDGELADAPRIGYRGSMMSAGNAINCRCFMAPLMGDES